MKIITDKWQNLWSSDEVRALILTSLVMQIGLIFLAPLRKCSTNTVLTLTLWLLYLTADYVATLALGNMSRKTDPAESGELAVLWAPFLLLHLGGPDSITSYSIEDNKLWWRHLLGLVVQVAITVYVFWQSPPKSWMWIPTMLVFISGLIKYAERTQSLRLGSMDNLKENIISEVSAVELSQSSRYRNIRLRNNTQKVDFISKIERESEIERENQFIIEGYGWLNIFKRLWVDVPLSSNLLIQSQDRFSEISPTDAFKLVAIELSFLYDILHTKAVHIHCTLGRVLRCISVVSILVALVAFHHLDMQKYASKDIIITYILFGAGLSLEVIATMLLVFSDWTVVSLSKRGWYKCFATAISTVVKSTLKNGKPRWSRTIGQYNLVEYCLRDKHTKLAKIMRIMKIKLIWDNMRESKSIPLPELLEDIMFTEAIRRAQNMHMYNVLVQARSHRGNKTLERYNQLEKLEWSIKSEFDECIILWHVATDICFYEEFTPNQSNRNGLDDTEPDVSWKISNYMIYLLTQQQSIVQGFGKTRFEHTCAALSAVIKRKVMGISRGMFKGKEARRVLMKREVVTPTVGQIALISANCSQPTNQMGILGLKKIWANLRSWGRRKREEDERKRKDEDDMGEMLLRDGLRLAHYLQEVRPEIRWKLISEMWMEMLGYAAIHCDSYQHAKSLSRGGECLTHLWLLMAHMGVLEENMIPPFEFQIV